MTKRIYYVHDTIKLHRQLVESFASFTSAITDVNLSNHLRNRFLSFIAICTTDCNAEQDNLKEVVIGSVESWVAHARKFNRPYIWWFDLSDNLVFEQYTNLLLKWDGFGAEIFPDLVKEWIITYCIQVQLSNTQLTVKDELQ